MNLVIQMMVIECCEMFRPITGYPLIFRRDKNFNDNNKILVKSLMPNNVYNPLCITLDILQIYYRDKNVCRKSINSGKVNNEVQEPKCNIRKIAHFGYLY